MSFTPKFVDLVRNTTTTTGTGNFALGPAVNGFTGFSQALETGDSFYYSCIGIDKPAEREVGRGTLIAGGAISRDPISGTKTNFTSGTKTIALIAAAEWFAGMQAGGSGAAAPAIATTRAELAALADQQKPALMCEHGREGLFVWDGSNLSTKVAADTRQGLHVAPASDASGASGAWVRSFSGPADIRWFGAVADCAAAGAGTSNTPAFDAARSALVAAGRGWLHIPKQPGAYRFASAPAAIHDQIKISGDGWSENPGIVGGTSYGGVAAYSGTVLCFDSDVAGLRFVGFTDNAANAATNEFFSSNGSLVRDLMLYSAGGTGAAAHGIASYVTLNLDNVRVQGFAGSGVYFNGDAVGTSANQYGNTAFSSLRSVSSRSNKIHGFYVNGNNSSVLHFIGCDSFGNGGGGYVQAAGFGNQYVNCHAASNNASFGTPAGFSVAQRTQCTSDWANLSDANCGAWHIPGLSDDTVLSACYTEGGGGPGSKSELAEAVVVIGGNIANVVNQKNTYSGTRIDGFKYYGLGEIYAFSGGAIDIKRGSLDISEDRSWANPASARLLWNAATGLNLGGSGSSCDLCIRRSDGTAVVLVPHNSSSLNINNNVQLNNGYVFWNDVSAFIGPLGVNGSGQAFATAAGGVNIAGRGSTYDVSLLNTGGATALRIPTNTTNVEVVGTLSASRVASTGAVTSSSPTAGVGYATGARATQTQATSKSTGVTVNAVAGDITLHAASVAANTTVSFVLTNSSIAANDTVILNHVATGTFGSYHLNAHGFAAGSCTIDVRNISAGALAEAIIVRFVVIKGG